LQQGVNPTNNLGIRSSRLTVDGSEDEVYLLAKKRR
jgi:hypothetical protein